MIEVEVENRSGAAVDEDGHVALARAVLAAEGVEEGELGIHFVVIGSADADVADALDLAADTDSAARTGDEPRHATNGIGEQAGDT